MGFLIIQVNDISQIKTSSFSIFFQSLLEIIETAIERSIQGSSIFKPLAIFV